jgi:N6-adenosine-specific RNA methylase IME4
VAEVPPLDVMAGLAVSTEAREAKDREDQRDARREARATVQRERPAPAPAVGTYRLIYADPPWRYEHVKTESRAIENQYPTMALADICALSVPAADDAVLFLWATSPKLAEALEVLAAWGFTYRTCAVWDKEQIGMGYYFRQQHELLLVGGRGTAPVPPAEQRLPSVFRSKRSDHSEKPTVVYGYLEAMYPTFTARDRVELFARQARAGWSAWGNEPAVAV